MSELDHMLGVAARGAAKDRGDDERIVAEALVAGRARHRAAIRARLFATTSVAVAIGVAAALVFSFGGGTPTARTEVALGSVELPTHDVLRAAESARYVIEDDRPVSRRVRIDDGAVLFEVARLGPGHVFEVHTGDLVVEVLGTVFSVDASPRGSAVRVFEGRVRIRAGEEVLELGAGESFGDTTGAELGRLDAAGLAAATARLATAETSVATRVAVAEVTTTTTTPSASSAAPDVADEAPPSSDERRVVRAAAPSASDPRAEEMPAAPSAEPSVETAALWLASGDAERALSVAASHEDDDAWALVAADALRALGRASEAATAYDALARRTTGLRAAQAAFAAASLRANTLHDDEAALLSLTLGRLALSASPLAERALALEARALARLGRTEHLAEVARDYRERFPDGPAAEELAGY